MVNTLSMVGLVLLFSISFEALDALHSILDAVRFIVAKYCLVAVHGGPILACFMSVLNYRNVEFDVGKCTPAYDY